MNERRLSCRDVSDLIDLYVSDDLEPGQADAVRAHVGRCESCRADADAFRRQHERLASLASSQMPAQLSPFFWQGIQREILLEEGVVEELPAVAPAPRTALRPILYALAALALVVATVFAAVTFFGQSGPEPAAPGNEVVRGADEGSSDAIPRDVPFTNGGLAPAGRPDHIEIEM